jgi:hypothetical protein
MAYPYSGQLNQNEVIGVLFNQIISQEVFGENIKSPLSVVDLFRVDGTLYGDTKTYISTDALYPVDWVTTGASSLLTVTDPPEPVMEYITIDKFKQIAITIYPYMTKRAFKDEGSYAQFIGVMLSWLNDTKKVYELTLFNAFIGTIESTATVNEVQVTLPDPYLDDDNELSNTQEVAYNKLLSIAIGEAISNLFIELADVGRDYNEHEFLRSYSPSDFVLIWNSVWYNKIHHASLPLIFHKEGVVDLTQLDQRILPARFFGDISVGVLTDASSRALDPMIIDEGGPGETKLFAGDLVGDQVAVTTNTTYKPDADIIAKLVHKKDVPFMSAFSVGTSFFDQQKLRENHWLTFGHNTLEHLGAFPLIKIIVSS